MHSRNATAVQYITYKPWLLANKSAVNSDSLWVFLNSRLYVFIFAVGAQSMLSSAYSDLPAKENLVQTVVVFSSFQLHTRPAQSLKDLTQPLQGPVSSEVEGKL